MGKSIYKSESRNAFRSMPSILADEMEYEDKNEYDSSDHELTISELLEKGK